MREFGLNFFICKDCPPRDEQSIKILYHICSPCTFAEWGAIGNPTVQLICIGTTFDEAVAVAGFAAFDVVGKAGLGSRLLLPL